MKPGFTPATLYESPFKGVDCAPRWQATYEQAEAHGKEPWPGSIEDFARGLLRALRVIIKTVERYGPLDLLIGGGYDSRILLALCHEAAIPVRCITDGEEEPYCSETLDYFDVPASMRYVHDLDRPDPYGLTDAVCEGWAPLYTQLRFTPPDTEGRTLLTGLGGGEWFSYPASGWHRGKPQRISHDTVVGMWMDCWPQYTLVPDAWARGYGHAFHPYCTPIYARVAARAHREWLVETDPPMLDAVRRAMLEQLDPYLCQIGWAPHRYDWRLTAEQKQLIDMRFHDSPLAEFWKPAYGEPSEMHDADHACLLAGFATWCDLLKAQGYTVTW
jgi:hypothetical protein